MDRQWQVTGATMATQMAQAGLLIYGFSALALPLQREFGAPMRDVALATTCLSLASSFGAPLAGRLIDRWSIRRLMLVGATMLGLATGGMLPMWSLIVAEQLGDAVFGRAMGLTNLLMVPLTASAAPLAGWTFDRTGSYHGVILSSMVILPVAALLVLALKPGRGAAP